MKIFLGYASEHVETAREVYSYLKTINDDVWFDKESLIGGDDWDREREAAQQAADLVVHLISAEVFARPGVVNREIRKTLNLVEDQPIGVTYVVFIRLDDLRMPLEFIRFQYIDHFRATWREQLSQAIAKRAAQLSGAVGRAMPERTTTITGEMRTASGVPFPSRVEASVSTEFYQASAEYLRYPAEGAYWDLVNSKIASEALSGYVTMTAEFKRLDDDDKARIKRIDVPHEYAFTMQEFFRKGEFLSVRSGVFWNTGGVHPNHGITTLNFLGPEHGFCTIQEILGHDEENAFRLADYCKKVLIAMFEDDGPDDYLSNAFEDRQNTWALVSQYNFDDRGITINFSPYAVLPYALGSHEVFVPWRFASSLLSDQFGHLEDQLREI